MKLVYDVGDKPKFGKILVFAVQQLLAIIAATIAVPAIVNGAAGSEVLSASGALVGAGFGSITYLLFTKFKSPVFLGSSFAFISPLIGAVSFGYFGVLIGAAFAALVYVVIALVIKFAGSAWVNKIMPPIVIGPTVAIIGLSLAGSAMGIGPSYSGLVDASGATGPSAGYNLIAILCGLVTFFVVCFCSIKGNKTLKLIPFIMGILAGYALAAIFSAFGYGFDVDYLKIVNFQPLIDNFSPVRFTSFLNYPDLTFLHTSGAGIEKLTGAGVANIALLYIPVAFVVFAEHIADHKNLSSIIERDLIKDPGLHRTLLGDGVGSLVGAIFGGIPNTTYGESIGCVAITKNASIVTILCCAVLCIVLSFFSPLIAFLQTIPSCVMGGVCLALYGFIAVSGLNMLRGIDLNKPNNLFVVSSILIIGIGGLTLEFGKVGEPAVITISSIATALIVGIIVNAVFNRKGKNDNDESEDNQPQEVEAAETPAVEETSKAENNTIIEEPVVATEGAKDSTND
ncbi:MAG: uracil-xanthine permease [Clostridia bacterium]|nr:uracil-xanthine permease [Clostridia bacterium]